MFRHAAYTEVRNFLPDGARDTSWSWAQNMWSMGVRGRFHSMSLDGRIAIGARIALALGNS